jgi:hypothetical protein
VEAAQVADLVERQAVEVAMEGLVGELGEMEGSVGMAEEAVGLEMPVEAAPQSAKYTTPLYAPIQTCYTKSKSIKTTTTTTPRMFHIHAHNAWSESNLAVQTHGGEGGGTFGDGLGGGGGGDGGPGGG